MIDILHVSKSYEGIKAVSDVSLTLEEGQVFGLVGTNGAGKSTLLRLIDGILKPDSGQILVDGQPVYDDPAVRENIFFISDEPYFFPGSRALDLKKWYRDFYPAFDSGRFDRLVSDFGLDPRRRIRQYSKGMRRQLAVICGICAGTPYLLCDETMDGLDPVMRQAIKSILAGEMEERGLTPVLSSHNLRELEDICDHVGLLHQGGILLSQDIADMKLNLQKIQCVFTDQVPEEIPGVRTVSHETRGRLHTYIVRGSREEAEAAFAAYSYVFFEILNLSLEEVFILETEAVGYDVKKLILG